MKKLVAIGLMLVATSAYAGISDWFKDELPRPIGNAEEQWVADAVNAAAASGRYTPPSSLPAAITQTEVDWFAEVADSSGFKGRMFSIGDTARTAKSWASDALDAADSALVVARQAKNRPVDFAGKTLIGVERQAALSYVAGLTDTIGPVVAARQRIQSGKSLTSDQEQLVANLWTNFLRQGAANGTLALQQVNQLAATVTTQESIWSKGLRSAQDANVRADSALDARLARVEATLALAFGAVGEVSTGMDNLTEMPADQVVRALAMRRAVGKDDRIWAKDQLAQMDPAFLQYVEDTAAAQRQIILAAPAAANP